MGISVSSGPYTGPKEISYLFIDGGYLSTIVEDISRKYFNGETLEISFNVLSAGFTKTFYYDCPTPRKSGETREEYQERVTRQQLFFNNIRDQRGYHVFEGVVTGKPGKVRQKQVDVKIAVDMLIHTIRGNMHKATIITGDQDFKPLIEALVQEGMYVTLWCDTRRTSDKLVYSADDRRPLNIQSLFTTFPKTIQNKYPLPKCFIHQVKNSTTDYTLIRKGKSNKEEPIELYQKDSNCLFICEHTDSNNFLHAEHNNIDFLLDYIDDIFLKCNWEDNV